MKKILIVGCLLLTCLTAYGQNLYFSKLTKPAITNNKSFIEARDNFKTRLTQKMKAPQSYSELALTDSIEEVTYPSGNLRLKGYLEKSNFKVGKKSPVLVYLHGGFALEDSDIEATRPFINKGFIVSAPTYRGENGNEGNFELFMGEVDDAKSAVEWIAKQPFTDTQHIYVFGHSIGGGLSLQLSFFPNLPIKQSGSNAGLYDEKAIKEFGLTFDTSNTDEIKYRTPLLNLDKIVKKHVVYSGKDDIYQMSVLQSYENILKKQKNLNIQIVDGDHNSSLEGAMNDFIKTYYKS